MITAAEDVRGGPLQSEGAPVQPKNAFGDVVYTVDQCHNGHVSVALSASLAIK